MSQNYFSKVEVFAQKAREELETLRGVDFQKQLELTSSEILDTCRTLL
jgi:hypothetical protein